MYPEDIGRIVFIFYIHLCNKFKMFNVRSYNLRIAKFQTSLHYKN